MYDRIKIDLTEGSGNLPSILKINKESGFYYSGTNILSADKKEFTTYTITEGSVGNNYNEFAVELPSCIKSDNARIMNMMSSLPNIAMLNKIVCDDAYITITESWLENCFYIYEINDYSYNAMTIRHYDFFVKVFIKNYNSTDRTYDDNKIFSGAVAVLKSYTMKKAWILVDKKAITSSQTSKLYTLIDFIYDFTKEEKDKKSLKFNTSNGYNNLIGLFGDGSDISPYFDKFTIDNLNVNNKTVLNKQGEYFKFKLLNNITINSSNPSPLTTYEIKNIKSDVISSNYKYDTDTFFKKFDIAYGESSKDDSKYTLSKEIYEYSGSSVNSGKRVLFKTRVKIYEEYPVMPDMIHYVYEINSSKASNISSITMIDIHKALAYRKQYLYNYNYSTFNIFKIGDSYYLELYARMPYDGIYNYDETEYECDKSDEWLTVLSSKTCSDIRSKYDPTKTSQNIYTDEYKLPYFGNDTFMCDILKETDPRIYSEEADVMQQRYDELTDIYFDILYENTDTSEANKIDAGSIITSFKSAGFRDNDSVSTDLIKKLNNIEQQNNTLCKNLSKFLPSNISLTSINANNEIVMQNDDKSVFFIYFRSKSSSVYVTFTYTESNVKTNEKFNIIKKLYLPYDTKDEYSYYIIPSEDTLLSVKIDTPVECVDF